MAVRVDTDNRECLGWICLVGLTWGPQAQLQLPHTGKQKDRFTEEMTKRNKCIIHESQPEISHYCNKCMQTCRADGRVFKVEAALTDGLTIGHPCCSTFVCPTVLACNWHQFCPMHNHLHLQCAVVGCSLPVVKLSKTVNGKVISRYVSIPCTKRWNA